MRDRAIERKKYDRNFFSPFNSADVAAEFLSSSGDATN
jgi:hypothetical protein